jgi:ABC-type cobalamin transport system permease subunit
MARKVLLYVLVGGAAAALNQLASAWRSWETAPTLAGGIMVGLLALAVLGAMGWVGLILYEADRVSGQVRHRIGLYEWILATAEARRRDRLGHSPTGAVRPGQKRPG